MAPNRTAVIRTSAADRALDEEVRRLRAKEKFDKSCLEWCKRIKAQGATEFFYVRQFFSCKEDEQYGSNWQRMVCDWLKIPEDVCQEFWERTHSDMGGRQTARKAINTRKSNVTNAIKEKFQGEWCG
jgi:hypothetical protein